MLFFCIANFNKLPQRAAFLLGSQLSTLFLSSRKLAENDANFFSLDCLGEESDY